MNVPASRSLVIRKKFAVSRERLFRAWCRPELMARWFFPAPDWRAEVSADVRVHGRWQVTMYDPGGGVHRQEGEYQEIRPVSRLVFSWSCDELGVSSSVVTLQFEEAGAETELMLIHELPDDDRIRREHEGGWQGCLASLERHFDSQQGVTA